MIAGGKGKLFRIMLFQHETVTNLVDNEEEMGHDTSKSNFSKLPFCTIDCLHTMMNRHFANAQMHHHDI